MIGIKLLVLCLKALEILSSDCAGWGCSPSDIKPQIVDGSIIRPEKYSWIASLQYEKQARFGICAGSVIHSRYVLTAAHCVKGEKIIQTHVQTVSKLNISNIHRYVTSFFYT